jgi:hypothetical protein
MDKVKCLSPYTPVQFCDTPLGARYRFKIQSGMVGVQQFKNDGEMHRYIPKGI